MVGSDILEPGHSTHGCGLHGDSHVDQVLCERYGLGIARDSDSAVHIPARLAILAVRNTNHGSTKLSDFGNFGSSFANNAAYQLIGNRHFVGLLRGLRPILMACKSGQSCMTKSSSREASEAIESGEASQWYRA